MSAAAVAVAGKKAREGRELQRYDTDGARLVAGCVPLVNGWVVLITNRKDGSKWGLPKGGWEQDEPHAAAAAARETFEEAGVKGVMGAALERESRYQAKSKQHDIRTQWFALYVTDLLPAWPESQQRRRALFPLDEALARVHKEEHRQALLEVQRRQLHRPRMPGVRGLSSKDREGGGGARWSETLELRAFVWRGSVAVALLAVLASLAYAAHALYFEQSNV